MWRLMILLLLSGGLVLVAVLALHPPGLDDSEEAGGDRPRLQRRNAPVTAPEAEVQTPAQAGAPDRHEVSVLAEGEEPEARGAMPWERKVVVPGLVRGRIDGAVLLEVLRSVGPVRFRRPEDLDALKEGAMIVRAQDRDEIPLFDLINLCREAGLVVDDAGRSWMVHAFEPPEDR